jgi:hypothetical protein
LAGVLTLSSPSLLRAAEASDAPKPTPKTSPFVDESAAGRQPGEGPAEPAAASPPLGNGQAACDCSDFAGPSGRVWVRSDYRAAWTKAQRVPVLAASDLAGTVPLFGGERVDVGMHDGIQITLGAWLDNCHRWALEGDYWDLRQEAARFHSGLVSGNQTLTRPFLDVQPDQQRIVPDAFPVAVPNQLAGQLDIDLTTSFQSAGLHVRRNLWSENWECAYGTAAGGQRPWGFRLDGTAGYRLYRLIDRLTIRQQSVVVDFPPLTAGDNLSFEDMFKTVNEFQGAEIGLIGQVFRGRWSAKVSGTMAMGGNHRIVNIRGVSSLAETNFPGGLLAEPSNVGHYTRNQFTVIPELGVEIGYALRPNLRTSVGYDVLYWNKVARAGEQVDPRINLADPVAGPPQFSFNESSFWVQGLRLGLELRY